MKDYTKYKIDEEVINVATEISERLPHYITKDIVHKAKQVLKECNRLLEEGEQSLILLENVGVVHQCLLILGTDGNRSPLKIII